MPWCRTVVHFEMEMGISNALLQTRTELGPSSIYHVRDLHPFLGSKGGQHILAAASSKQATSSIKEQATKKPL